MRCKWCGDIIELGPPTKEQLEHENNCPWQEHKKAYEVYEFCWGKEKAEAYKKMREEDDKVLL